MNIEIFKKNGFDIRTVTVDGTPMLVAKDVALALGYKNTNDAITRHCKGSTIRRPIQTNGGIQNIRVITESDMYRLIFGSKLETAQQFVSWVFEEVLPATNSYRFN